MSEDPRRGPSDKGGEYPRWDEPSGSVGGPGEPSGGPGGRHAREAVSAEHRQGGPPVKSDVCRESIFLWK